MSVITHTYRIEVRPVPCIECGGVGRFVLFTSVERCVACNGLGQIQLPHWVTLNPDGSPDRLYVQDGAGWREVKDQPGA